MPVTNGFYLPAPGRDLRPGSLVATMVGEDQAVGLIIEMRYSTGLLILADADASRSVPRMIPIDDVNDTLISIDDEVRLEPLEGDAIGHLGLRAEKLNGSVRVSPDGSLRMFVRMGEGDEGLWMDLGTGDEAKATDTRLMGFYRSWSLVRYSGEGATARRTVISTHDQTA